MLKLIKENSFLALSYGLILFAAILLWPAYSLYTGHPFCSNLLQNFLVCLATLGITFLIGYYTASHLLYKKLLKVAPALADLVEALRESGKINEQIARYTIIFASSLISERAIRMAHSESKSISEGEICRICKQAHDYSDDVTSDCRFCKIPREVWAKPDSRYVRDDN